jgi:hypothetical protein
VILKKSLSFKVGVILSIIWLFVFGGYLETFGAGWIYSCENPSPHCYFNQQNFIIEIAGKFGYFKKFSESEKPKMILLIFIVCWGIAIIFVLGAILYRIVIGPLIEKRKLRRNKRRQNQLDQNRQGQAGDEKPKGMN